MAGALPTPKKFCTTPNAELLLGIHHPELFAVFGGKTVQLPFRAVNVDAVAIDDRRGARPVVVAVHVHVIGRVFELPDELAGFALETAEAELVRPAVEEEEPTFADRRRDVAVARFHGPDSAEAFLRPGRDYPCFTRDAVAGGTKE
jgi:hypothetical protein